MLFLRNNTVFANAFTEKEEEKEIMPLCNEERKCVPLCIYKAEADDNPMAYIGFYANGESTWEIKFLGNLYSTNRHVYYQVNSGVPPKIDIYDADYGSGNWDTANNSLYAKLNDDFMCPSFVSIDSGSGLAVDYNELCFASTSNKCYTRFKDDNFTSFLETYPNKYSFRQEYFSVVGRSYYNLRHQFELTYGEVIDIFGEKAAERYKGRDSNDKTFATPEDYNVSYDKNKHQNYLEKYNKEKIKFLSEVLQDGGYVYDASLSAKENALKNCELFKNEADGKYEDYLNLIQQKNMGVYINNYVNPFLANAVTSYINVQNYYYKSLTDKGLEPSLSFLEVNRHKYAYNYDFLLELLNGKKLALTETDFAEEGFFEEGNMELFDMFDFAYSRNIKDAFLYLGETCKDAGVEIDLRVDCDGDGELDSDSYMCINNAAKDFSLKKYKDPTIDITTTFDCGFLHDIAGLISRGFFTLEMAGLVMVVAFSVMDYVKVFLNDDSDAMKKANSHLFKRLILLVVLFLLPGIVNFSLRLFNVEGLDSDNPLCVEITNK